MKAQRAKTERRILLNASALGVAEGLGQLANFIFVISFARSFGATQMAYYSVAMASGAIAALIMTLGTQGLLVREFSRDRTRIAQWLGVLLPVQGVLGLLAWLVATAITVLLVGDRRAMTVALAICAYQMILRLATVLNTPLVANERMVRTSAANAAYRIITLALGLVAIHYGAGPGLVAWTFVVGAVMYFAVVWRQNFQVFGQPGFRWAPREASELFRLSAPFFGVQAFAAIYARGAVIMLSAIATPQSVGVYAAADRLMVAVALAPTMLGSAVYPALTRVAARSRVEVRALCGRSVLLMLITTLPLAMVFTMFAHPLIGVLFGPLYRQAAPALQILTWTLPIVGVQSLLGSQLMAVNQQHLLARARFLGLTLFVLLAPLLIWKFGFRGAAVAVLVSDAVLLLHYLTILLKVEATPTFGTAANQAT
ncbi:MAG TPA: flippase [Steroidobacteraceae bacterium]